jgi:hypothetical protein
MFSGGRLPILALLLALAPFGAGAQTPKPLGAEDAVLAYGAAQISRAAVRDQLDLCAEDADKLDQVFTKLRPAGAADRSDWTDWGDLFRRIGGELKACLRSYSKQMALHGRDLALLRERLPLLKEPKRLTISPKQVGAINAYTAGLDKELESYVARARGMANSAELASGRVGAMLREAGVVKIELPQGFGEGL